MESIEELLLIPGITPEVYFGDPEADPPLLPLDELLTVHGSLSFEVNFNTAPWEVIYAIVEGRGQDGETTADYIVERRDTEYGTGPYEDEAALQAELAEEVYTDPEDPSPQESRQTPEGAPPVNPGLPKPVVMSRYFRLTGDGMAGEAKVRIEAYVWRDREITSGEVLRVLDWRVIR